MATHSSILAWRIMDRGTWSATVHGVLVTQTEESACDVGDLGSVPGLGRSPGVRKWQPTPSILAWRIMDREAWWATVHVVTKSWKGLSN